MSASPKNDKLNESSLLAHTLYYIFSRWCNPSSSWKRTITGMPHSQGEQFLKIEDWEYRFLIKIAYVRVLGQERQR